ncbi:hypothetical protein EPN90_03745, partial [Patescibacteria group bacterium]
MTSAHDSRSRLWRDPPPLAGWLTTPMSPSARRRAALTLVCLFLTAEVGVFGLAAAANAQGGAVTILPSPAAGIGPVFVRTDVGVRDSVRFGLLATLLMSSLNAINYFAQKIAFDYAEQVSEGGPGQKPLFFTEDWKDYLRDVALDSVGEFLGTLNQSGLLPFNVCAPSINIVVPLALGILFDDYRPPKPKCEWKAIQAAYKNLTFNLTTDLSLKATASMFEPGQSELDAAIRAASLARQRIPPVQNPAALARSSGRGFLDLRSPLSRNVLTPAELIRHQTLAETVDEPNRAKDLSWRGSWEVIKAAPENIGLAALNTFITHLVSKLIQKALKGLLFHPPDQPVCNLGIAGCSGGMADQNAGNNPEDLGTARRLNADLITPALQSDARYDILTELATCPDKFRTPNNCAVDTQLAALVGQGPRDGKYFTVKEALDAGYLHGDWPLISNSETHRARNADPYCFASGYCYSNLVKLRKARILPVGWELAAAKSPADPVKLSEVVAKFNDCPTPEDPNPANHPWCKLIDPNWILKVPVTQCRLRGFGATMLDDQGGGRAEICLDQPSCMQEDKNGNCLVGYGYCAREKNIWRIGGRECPSAYASCASFAGRAGESLTVLQSSLDQGVCNAENVGCRAYSTVRDSKDASAWLYSPGRDRVFLNRQVSACEAKDAGCGKVIDKEGLRRNLVLNSSFEEDVAPNAGLFARYWTKAEWGTQWLSDQAMSRSGSHSLAPPDYQKSNDVDVAVKQTVNLDPNATYTVSFYGRQEKTGEKGGLILRLGVLSDAGVVPIADSATNCAANGEWRALFGVPAGVGWERYSCTLVLPPKVFTPPGYAKPVTQTGQLAVNLYRIGDRPLVDDLQIEDGSRATDYHGSAFEGGALVTLKTPPEYLGCSGEAAKDPKDCGRYAQVCRSDEVGCDRFTPLEGGIALTAVVSGNDGCPSECVGYETFRKEETNYDTASYPLYFIPKTAASCGAAANGCSEFTNLDTQAAGGEAREYFTYLRPCERPTAEVPTYYTWEGSDTAGYQLKEWHLKVGAAFPNEPAGTTGVKPPATVPGYNPAFCTKAIYQSGGDPDCREFLDADGKVYYRLYSKTIIITSDCHPYRLTKAPEDTSVKSENACTGGKHWAVGKCLVCEDLGGTWNAAAGECTFYGLRSESNTCSSAENGCRLFTGNAGGNVQTMLTETFEGALSSGWLNTLKANPSTVATSTESTVVGGASLKITGSLAAAYNFVTSTPPALTQGDLYLLNFWAKGANGNFANLSFTNPTTNETVKFLDPAVKQVGLTGNWKAYSFGPVVLTINPKSADAVKGINLSFAAGMPGNSSWYLDNIELKKIGSAVAAIDGSWKTPAICDQSPAGAPLPQYYLGCASYTDRTDATRNLRSFDRLCRSAAVGCRAYLDTRNNDFIGYEYWNALATLPVKATVPTPVKGSYSETVCTVSPEQSSCRYNLKSGNRPALNILGTVVECSRPDKSEGSCSIDGTYICEVKKGETKCAGSPSDLVTVPPDRTVYLVDAEGKRCDASQAGCSEVGAPQGSVCGLLSPCKPSGGAVTCKCEAPVENCGYNAQNQFICSAKNQFVCDVPSGQSSCTYALPQNEPYGKLSYTSKNLILNPELYQTQVCSGPAVGCEEWKSANRNAPGIAYFKTPDGRYCEYREKVQINGAEYSGYFLQGKDSPCDPTYVIGGNYYGLRKTGDANYKGYVGSCSSEFAGCTEFIDHADLTVKQIGNKFVADPARYYYVKDQSIDDASCNGQASPKEGCLLLEDTSKPEISYSAVGTYGDSANKDYRLVPARPGYCGYKIDCANGAPVQNIIGNLGAGWVAPFYNTLEDYLANPQFWPFASKGYQKDILKKEFFYRASFTPKDAKDVCQLIKKLFNADLPFTYAGRGCSVKQDCAGNGLDASADCVAASSEFTPSAPANSVVKVSRDRVCGAWFACKSSSPVFDPRTNRFREVCDQIGLCDQASLAEQKDTSKVDITLCKRWVNDAESRQILSEKLYRERDVSFSGFDYSGYSVPHQFPASVLSQAKIGSRCAVPQGVSCDPKVNSNAAQNGKADCSCQSSFDCPSTLGPDKKPTVNRYSCDPVYSLGNDLGACPFVPQNPDVGKDGDTCLVGGGEVAYCQNPAQQNCCRNGIVEGIEGCDDGNSISGDGCSAGCGLEGKCFGRRCYQSAFGKTDPVALDGPQALEPVGSENIGKNTLEFSCRAYPEASSPVPGDVVLARNTDTGAPESVKQGFQGAAICEEGENCECNYQKAKYSGGELKYFGSSAPLANTGRCSGGPFDGAACDPLQNRFKERNAVKNVLTCNAAQVAAGGATEGDCQPVQRADLVRGFQGFCLERDETTPIYGRELAAGAPSRACLTWLPTDRLSGQPDLFNQYKSATYELRDSYACALPQVYRVMKASGPYAKDFATGKDVNAQQDIWLGTVASDGDQFNKNAFNPFLFCPPSTGFVVMGACTNNSGEVEGAGLGIGPPMFNQKPVLNYVCVPWGSVHLAERSRGKSGNGQYTTVPSPPDIAQNYLKECSFADFPISGQPSIVNYQELARFPQGICAQNVSEQQLSNLD